ncbi:protein kinase Scy1 [Blumeria hordei DH14]|uniref:Protein kinase Scy1 n=1 Tax=Blumeria graminis f. sp. hordei (strain DH14) TaxID=546991 RepID=N1JPW8_BLUG1|nr:protein kinase Scy1 [Blumeria hordei DH14]
MFSSALKSFSSNINSNYSISQVQTTTSGPWKIYDAKKKTSGKLASIFVFERKSLEPQSGSLSRPTSSVLKKDTEDVVERLKKEASSLARLRHPNILELVEPIEETRNGGLQFATEMVTASLSGLLKEKDEREKNGETINQREDAIETSKAECLLDELEIQKGLEQMSKALEFLHDNAQLIHGNLTPDAIFINSKSDWKISGLSFSCPPDGSTTKISTIPPLNLPQALNIDSRLPRCVQMNLDYCSPDFVLDSNLNVAADMFSLGLIIITLYNYPHNSPLQTNSSVSSYKKLFASSSAIPSASNGYLCSRPLPKDIETFVLPKLITRWPAQRMTAKEFQQSPYFDNILISTIRFLDSLPAKTPNEKSQFLRGFSRISPSFPKSVLEKKVLPALLEQVKDRELLSLILQNVFNILGQLSSRRKIFTEVIMHKLKEIFVNTGNPKISAEKDPTREASLMVLLDHISMIIENCSGKEFKDRKLAHSYHRSCLTTKDMLPIIYLAIESPVHRIVDTSLQTLPLILPVLDFTTIKNELFPVIASVFSKTSSLGIKVRGLEAFVILCGGSNSSESENNGFGGTGGSRMGKQSSSSALDKYTMQEKILPLVRAIKTKEPAVAIAALAVLRQVGHIADPEFIALDILPVLWSMSLGPLLDLKQFQSFMSLVKELSARVEIEQTRKLQELSGSKEKYTLGGDDSISTGNNTLTKNIGSSDDTDSDFERLVKGATSDSSHPIGSNWNPNSTLMSLPSGLPSNGLNTNSFVPISAAAIPGTPSINFSSSNPKPDLSRFATLTPRAILQAEQPHNSFIQAHAPQVWTPTVQQSTVSSLNTAFQSPNESQINWPTSIPSNFHHASNTMNLDQIRSATSSATLPGNKQQLSYVPSLRPQSALSSRTPTQNPQLNSDRYNSFSLPPPPEPNKGYGPSSGSYNHNNLNAFGTHTISPQSNVLGVFSNAVQPDNSVASAGYGQGSSNQNGMDSWESLL